MGSHRASTRRNTRSLTAPEQGGILALALITLILGGCTQRPQADGTVTGLVVAVEGDLIDTRSFTILTDDGEVVMTPTDETVFRFAETHLRDHLRSGEPVEVEYRSSEDGQLIPLMVDDA